MSVTSHKIVSVVILNWNGVDLLRKYLPSVISNTQMDWAEVMVVDNGSSDASLTVLKDEFPTVKVISFEENLGFAEGYNKAIRLLETPYTVLLNSDVAVSPHWLEPLMEYAQSHPKVAALQPKILSDRDRTSFEYAGACGGYLDNLGYPYCRGRLFDTVEKDMHQYDQPIEVMWATGACLFVRTDLYRKAGGLDAHFFAHMEEIDLCWRLRSMGYKLMCIPTGVVYHYGGASLAMGNPKKTFLNFRNSILMLHKNLPENQRGSFIFKRMCVDGLAALNFLLHGQLAHFKAVIKAHQEARKMIGTLYKDYSNPMEEQKNVADAHIEPFKEERISVLWQYYACGRKKYSNLRF